MATAVEAAARGPLRVVVSCAGVGIATRIVRRGVPDRLEEFQQVIDINLVGTFNVIRPAAAHMAEREPEAGDRGVISNTASIAPGLFDTPLFATLPEAAQRELGASVPHPSRRAHPS